MFVILIIDLKCNGQDRDLFFSAVPTADWPEGVDRYGRTGRFDVEETDTPPEETLEDEGEEEVPVPKRHGKDPLPSAEERKRKRPQQSTGPVQLAEGETRSRRSVILDSWDDDEEDEEIPAGGKPQAQVPQKGVGVSGAKRAFQSGRRHSV
ncbi:MAG TPA: hypothetical protein VFM05_06050 [Candidatus Saccharimonadales bacterium]|nr:hypothetical protein [Candidatus Saccharimonadales bacterium]